MLVPGGQSEMMESSSGDKDIRWGRYGSLREVVHTLTFPSSVVCCRRRIVTTHSGFVRMAIQVQ